MSSEDSDVNGVKPERARMQFGLGTMFVLTAVVASACAVLFALPDAVAVPLLLALTIALPAVLTTFVIYGGTYLRTFCIGALFPAATLLFAMASFLGYLLAGTVETVLNWYWFLSEDTGCAYRWYVGTCWLLTFVIGLICVGARWLVARKKKPR